MWTDEPAVITWQIALSPQGRPPQKRHWWRELVTDAWHCANHAWELEREAVAIGYPTEMREFAVLNPRPKLRDFMVHLSHGTLAPERIYQ